MDLFSTYGPSDVVQHLVDRYIAGPGALVAPDARLLGLVAEQLRIAVGAIGPDIDLSRMDTRGSVRLSEELRENRLTALFFYSSTCDHCHAEMPALNALFEEFHERGFGIIGIALDDSEEDFRRNIQEMGIRYPCYSEFKGWGAAAAQAYAVKATPTILVLDAERRIQQKPYDSQELSGFLIDRLVR